MSDEIPTLIHHLSIGVNDFDRAVRFYDAIFATLGGKRQLEFPGAVAYGKQWPEFWVQTPINGKAAQAGNGTHFAFIAKDRAAVDAFHAAGLRAGGSDDGAPGLRPDYGPEYYGAFLRDPEGHKVEAAIVAAAH